MADDQRGRRRILLGATTFAFALAGCVTAPAVDDEDEGTPTPVPQPTPTPEPTPEEPPDGLPSELPTDPADEDFVDATGVAEVEVITREGAGDEPTFVFDPPFLRVDVDATVRWVNRDGVFHTVTSTPTLDRRTGGGDVFDATITAEGDTFEWVAGDTGRQAYYCAPHAGFMFGAIDIV